MSDSTIATAEPAAFTQPARMDPTDKGLWLKALRSGAFKQTKGMLYNPQDNGFCCLGVLRLQRDFPRDDDSELLQPGPCGIDNIVQGHLAGANDGDGFDGGRGFEPVPHQEDTSSTFAEIADWVEKWL